MDGYTFEMFLSDMAEIGEADPPRLYLTKDDNGKLVEGVAITKTSDELGATTTIEVRKYI